MNDDIIQSQINEVVNDSPAVTKSNAENVVKQKQGSYSTLRTSLPEEMPTAPAQQYTTTPEQGIEFSKNTDEVITGGTALPNLKYDTRFKTAQDGGDPLYFEPNFQPVVPFPVTENLESDTLNSRKLAWNIAVTNYGANDKDYVGYYLLPEQGSMSFWDHLINSSVANIMATPAYLVKGATGVATTALKLPAVVGGAFADLVAKTAEMAPESDLGSLVNGIKRFSQDASNQADYVTGQFNLVQDIVDQAVSPLEKWAFENWDADITDQSLKAMLGRGIASGAITFGLAAATKNPELAFTFMNFANTGNMRRNAVNYGVSPKWAEAYSIAGPMVNSWLDTLQFEALVNSASLINAGGVAVLKNLGSKGLLKGVAKHGPREAVAMLGEGGVEIIQEGIEGAFDPEYRKDPYTASLVAGISAMAIKAAALPFSIRNANLQEQQYLASQAGLTELLNEVRAAGNSFIDDLVKQGVVDESQREAVLQALISEAPDTIIKTLREGAKGELDKIPAENRKQFLNVLKQVQDSFGKNVFSPETFKKLDSETTESLANAKGAFSDSESEMIKGIVRGVYVLSAISNANNPDYKGFQVPRFEVTKSANSSYNPKTNVLSISGTRSDTMNTNLSPEYAGMVRQGFVPSTAASDKMASLLHELTHWMDAAVGKKGFGNFLENYYNSIATVFGNDKALSVYNASKAGEKRVKPTGSENNATEYAAQAVARLGKRAADTFGLGKSEANEFLSYANIMLNQLANLEGVQGQKMLEGISAYQTAVQKITKANMDKLSDLIEVYGSDRIKDALARFTEDGKGFNDFAEFLANENMLRDLYDVMDSFADAAGIEKINDLFDGNEQAKENFVTAGDSMFRNGYDNAVEEVRVRRAEAKSQANGVKAVEAKADPNAVKTPAGVILSNDTLDLKSLILADGPEPIDSGVQTESGNGEGIQSWAQQALGAQESIKESKEAGAQEPKQIFADKKIDGRNLTEDIDVATKGIVQRLKKPMNKLTKWFSSSQWGWGLDTILVNVLGREAAEKFDVAGKYSAKQNARSKYWEEFTKRLEPVLGKQSDKSSFAFNYKTMVTDLGMPRLRNVEMIDPVNPELSRTQDVTGWEAMYVYLMQKQGYGARVQKGTTTNIKDIVATLTEDEKRFADAMSEQLMSMYEGTFGKVSYKNYFPIMDAEHELFHELSIDSLIQRQKTDDTIAIVDAGRVFSQYVSRWASHESGFFQEIKRLKDVFGYRGVAQNETGPQYKFDPEEDEARMKASASLAHGVEMAIGKNGLDNIRAILETQLRDGQEEIFDASANSILNQTGRNIMKSMLAMKFVSLPKNLTNMFMMWGGAKDQNMYWNSFAEGWGNPKRTFDYMMANSPEIKQRWGGAGGINEYLDQNTLGGNTAPAMKLLQKTFGGVKWSGGATTNMAKFSAAMDMMGDAGLKMFMQSGDMIANVFGGYGLVKDYMAQGLSEQQAFAKLDRYIVEHQSSSNLMMKPLIQLRNNKGFFGQLFAFTSEQVVKAASVLGKFDEVKMGTATKSEAIANAVSIAISAALYSALATGVWDLWSDDEKAREDTEKALLNAAVDQAVGGLVAGNALISPFVSYLIGDNRIGGMRHPLYEYAIDGVGALKKEQYDRVVVKAASALGMFVGADNAWNTLLGISLLTDSDPAVRYAGKLMTAGYTENRAKRRSGVDVRKEIVENKTEE